MEAKDDQTPIRDIEFISLLESAKKGDSESMLLIIDLFRKDIQQICRYIRLPEEEATSEIICEFLEFALNNK